MSFLKEKTGYKPTGTEVALAWFFTAAAGVATAVWLWKSCGP